jgi:chromosome segregation ATPase
MKSFKNDDKIILQQKIIHLGAEVKRLTAVVERLSSKTFLKNIEKEKLEQEEKIQELTGQLARSVEEGNEKVKHLQQEIAQYQLELSKQREMHISRTSTLQDEAFELKKELTKQKEDHQGKLVTISNEVHQLKQQCELERTGHLKTLNLNEELNTEIEELKRELDKQSAINMDLEKEYEMVKETVKSLLIKIESSNQAHEGYQTIADINEKLEEENQSYRKMIAELKEEVKTLYDENSLLTKDIKKLNECVNDMEKKGDQVIHESIKVSSLESKKTTSPYQEEDKRIQSWFYNNVKKST